MANPDGTLNRAEIIKRRFEYHAPSRATREIHERVSFLCSEMAEWIINTTVESREQAIALTKLEELRMAWNQGVAFDGQGFDPANR